MAKFVASLKRVVRSGSTPSPYSASNSSNGLPHELWDRILDHLHDCRQELKTCSLVQRSWLSTCRFHLFHAKDLWRAIGYHSDAIVGMILAREEMIGIDINTRENEYHRPALSLAAEVGCEVLIRLLLSRPGIRVDATGTGENTPLLLASALGNEQAVRLLLEQDKINVNHRNHDEGRTALSLAAEKGCEGIVKALLSRGDIDVNLEDMFGRTPLSWAAGEGHKNVVELILAHRDVKVNTQDTYCRNALGWAEAYGHLEAAELLRSPQSRGRLEMVPDRSGTAEPGRTSEKSRGILKTIFGSSRP